MTYEYTVRPTSNTWTFSKATLATELIPLQSNFMITKSQLARIMHINHITPQKTSNPVYAKNKVHETHSAVQESEKQKKKNKEIERLRSGSDYSYAEVKRQQIHRHSTTSGKLE